MKSEGPSFGDVCSGSSCSVNWGSSKASDCFILERGLPMSCFVIYELSPVLSEKMASLWFLLSWEEVGLGSSLEEGSRSSSFIETSSSTTTGFWGLTAFY